MFDSAELTALFQRYPVGLFTLSSDNRVLAINDSLCGWLGYQANELIGQSVNEIFSRSGKIYFLTTIYPVLQNHGGIDETNLRFRGKQGDELPALVNARRDDDGEGFTLHFAVMPIHRRFVFEDQLIAARELAEQALLAKREALETLEKTQATLERKQQELLAVNARLQLLATTDGLTKIANRRSFDEFLENHLSELEQLTAITLVVVDIDRFKPINDNFGHATGDLVLREFAEMLQQWAAQQGFPARIGGEEFAVILPNCDVEQAASMTQHLLQQVRNHQWPHGAMTVSAGVAVALLNDSPRSLLARADKALYEAKNSGRDRLVIATDNI